MHSKNRVFMRSHPELTNDEIANILGVTSNYVSMMRGRMRHAVRGDRQNLGIRGELEVSKKLEQLGIRNKLMSPGHPFDILLENGITIDVKTDLTPSTYNNYTFYSFTTKSTKQKSIDFLILFIMSLNEFFVIPYDVAPMSIKIYGTSGRKSKYDKYRNRFDLLADGKV